MRAADTLLSFAIWDTVRYGVQGKQSVNKLVCASLGVEQHTRHTVLSNENCFGGFEYQMSQGGGGPILLLSHNTREFP